MSEQDEMEGLWIKTQPRVKGKGYDVVISYGADWAETLTQDRAVEYAQAMFEAVTQAEFDAAVLKQLADKVGMERGDAAMFIAQDLRADRRPIANALRALRYEPGVTMEGKPFVKILLDNEAVGQMDCDAAKRHAIEVLEAPFVAQLDSGYRRALVHLVGLDDDTALAAVGDLGSYR